MTVNLKDVGSGFKRTAINENFDTIETTLNSYVLMADGSKQLEGDLDLNSNNLLNGGLASFTQVTINGEILDPDSTGVTTLPAQSGNAGKHLVTNGSSALWKSDVAITLAEAVASTTIGVGQSVVISDRGYGVFDVVLASGVTPDTFSIIQCVGDATLALELRVEGGVVDLMWFGFLPDWNGVSGTDNILTLRAIFEYVDLTGYSTSCSGKGTAYVDWTTLGLGSSEAENVLHTFDDLHNVDFNFGGVTLKHNTPQDDGRLLMRFDNSSFITLSEQNHIGTLLVDTPANHRLANIWLVNFRENCNNITHRNIKVNNIYRTSGYGATTANGLDSGDRYSTRVHTVHFENVEMVDCKYGLHCNNSGDNLTGKITSRNLVRTHYIQNAKNHDLIFDSQYGRDKSDILITNQIDDNYPQAENVIDNIKINYITDGKTVGAGTSGLYEGFVNFTFIQINDLSTIPGTISNIDINLEVNNTPVDVVTNIVSLSKYYSVAGTIVSDPTANSEHRFKNISISGFVAGGANCTQSILALPQPVFNAVTTDWSACHFANINVSNFICNGDPGEYGIYIDEESAVTTDTPLFNSENVILGGTLTIANPGNALTRIANTVTKDEVWYDGYVIGSNANGEYKRYADGKLEMTFTAGAAVAISSATGSLFQIATASLTFPFVATSIDSIEANAGKNVGIAWATIDSNTLSSCVVRLIASVVASSAYPEYSVTGRWK